MPSAQEIRENLIVQIGRTSYLSDEEKALFLQLAKNYSGLSDMAVPAWLLCAALVKKDGYLAMVVPETWLMTAIAVLSEIGGDMSVFPTAKNLCSWAGCCPRNDQSGAKVKSSRISRAGSYLKPLLVQVANALIHSRKHPEFAERYRRIKARRGHKKAIIAVCKMLLTAIWNILSKLVPYSPAGFLSTSHDLPPSKSLTVAQGLSLLRRRGFILTDDPLSAP